MGKTLRVGFAMGGGVSLGTFCGSALAQALKLLIVFGRDHGGQPFDRVEIDVFSGASAGALSLSAMLRSLARPDPASMARARGKVEKEFGVALNPLTKAALEDLYAAQVMQDFQERLWSQEIKLSKLLGEGGDGGLRFKASLLDRGAVERIAREFVVKWDGAIDLGHRRLLASRVLYACTLTNLTPVVADATTAFPGKETGFIGLNDGMRSFTHRDLRVFDLNFVAVKNPGSELYADRWCLYHDGPAKGGLIGSLNEEATWAQIAATAIASGAFPGAFEPVVLTRKAFEFGPRLWSKTMGRDVPPKKDFDGQEPFPFSYFDGGTLNNEPIREAFRLASFLDGHTRASDPKADFQRLIVFVDPFVSDTRPSFRVPGHRAWGLDDPNVFGSLDGFDLRRLSSLERLLPHVFTLVGAVSNESRVIEADKVHQVRSVFALRDGIREALFSTLADTATKPDIETLFTFCEQRLVSSKEDEMIPPGPMTLAGELERVCNEERNSAPMKDLARLQGRAAAFRKSADPSADPDIRLWLRALVFVAVDLILGLEGKLEHADLVAIAPFVNLKNTASNQSPDRIYLPGGAFSGFAGFMSDLPDKIDFAAARCCAAEFLRECGLVDPVMPLPDGSGLKLDTSEQKQLEKEIQAGINQLADRVSQMVRHAGFVRFFPGLDALADRIIASIVKKKVKGLDWREKQETTCTFRIRVPNERFELDGQGFGDGDSKPVENPADGGWDLVTVAAWNHAQQSWSGGFVKDGRLDVDTDGTAFLKDSDFCEIALPTAALMADAETLPNPTFSIQLKSADKGRQLPASRWTSEPGVMPLEQTLVS